MIREAAPKAELHEAVIDDILKCLKLGEKVHERRIAKGTEPQPGANGKLLLLVKKFGSKAEVSVDSKGFAKFSELALFDNVQKGQQVARIYPPKPGVDGANALGEPIPAATGAPIKVTLDKSLNCADGPTAEYQLVTSLIARPARPASPNSPAGPSSTATVRSMNPYPRSLMSSNLTVVAGLVLSAMKA